MKLLIADDSKVSRMMLQSITQEWGYDVVLAEDGEQAWQIMQQENPPALLLLDWEMPKRNGVEVCEQVIAQNPEHPPYVMLLTSRTSPNDIVEGLSRGANDYIAKPFDSDELKVRLQVGKRMIEIQNKLKDTLAEVTLLATNDSLTGIFNRRAVLEMIPREIKRVERLDQILCVGMCDIDHFKKINDTYGHLVGDEVIKEVTKRMQHALRDYDLIGRYGGEEFVIVTPIDQIDARVVYQRVCDNVSRTPFLIGEHVIDVTISCGVSVYSEDDNYDESLVIGRADKALYQAKEAGRNRVVQAESQHEAPVAIENL
ncbi:diguanylate cyclase [Psychrobium sp. MM17-31]|uniref:GGDEF domain-containing response regulator n=1 Tax=Psychrobium sp. MM17-31 TaxID=2917758 RepID=UPI001EF48F26|nr:diguanylate cyclase [Psychrobium sp. MM17-31]